MQCSRRLGTPAINIAGSCLLAIRMLALKANNNTENAVLEIILHIQKKRQKASPTSSIATK